MNKKLQVTLVKSPIGYTLRQKKTVRALGLGHINQTVVLPDTPPMRGMVNAIIHLVKVEEVEE